MSMYVLRYMHTYMYESATMLCNLNQLLINNFVNTLMLLNFGYIMCHCINTIVV